MICNFSSPQVLAKDSDRVNQRFSEAKERGIRIQNRRVTRSILTFILMLNRFVTTNNKGLWFSKVWTLSLYLCWIIRSFIKRIVHILEIGQTNVQVTSEEIYSHLSETGPVIVLTNANQLHCRWYIIYRQVTYWRDQRCFLDSGFDQKGTKWRILI